MFQNNMLNKVMHLNEYEINFYTIELFHFDILVKQNFLYEMEVYQKKRITKNKIKYYIKERSLFFFTMATSPTHCKYLFQTISTH